MLFNAMAKSESSEDDVKLPHEAMLQLSFRNRVEREMFSNVSFPSAVFSCVYHPYVVEP
jgi:hypothetical protein